MPPIIQEHDIHDQVVVTECPKIKEMSIDPITAEEEYNKNPKLKKSDIAQLREWINNQPHLPKNISEEQLIMFHHSCYYNLEDTKSCIDVYYTIRLEASEYFVNRDVTSSQLQNSLKVLEYGILPVRDPNGYQIIFHRLKMFDASKYSFADGVKLLSMALDACLHVDGTAPGYIFLFDMRGVKFAHLTRLSIGALRKFFHYVQEGLPVRLKAIHVLNTRPLVDKIMLLIRPFMKKDLINMVHFHTSDEMEKVYDVLPRCCLPSDFGGDLPSCDQLHENYIEWMRRLKKYFEEEEKSYSKNKPNEEKGKCSTTDLSNDIRSLEID